MNHLLIDADMFAFRSCASCEHDVDWGDNIWTLHVDLNEAKARFTEIVESAIEHALDKMQYNGSFEVLFCFSSPNNFRKKIMPTYKANRANKRKPVGYHAIVEWVKKNYLTYEFDNIEADDVMGILATKDTKAESLIISGDKDLWSIPCCHYDFLRDKFAKVSKDEADYNFLMQTLTGDQTDGYTGCPRIGKVTAAKLLDKDCSWKTVVKAYEKAGLSEKVALQQARVARILRATDYDFKKKKVLLWKP